MRGLGKCQKGNEGSGILRARATCVASQKESRTCGTCGVQRVYLGVVEKRASVAKCVQVEGSKSLSRNHAGICQGGLEEFN